MKIFKYTKCAKKIKQKYDKNFGNVKHLKIPEILEFKIADLLNVSKLGII